MQSPTTNRPPLGLGKLIRRGLAAFVIVLVLLFAGARYNLRRQLNAELDRIRAAGQPVTLDELASLYRNLEGRPDGSKELEAALAKVAAIGLELSTKGIPGTITKVRDLPLVGEGPSIRTDQPISSEFTNALQLALKELVPALDKLSEVLSHTNQAFRYPIDLTGGAGTRLQHLAPLRRQAHWNALRAALESDRGNTQGAIRPIVDSLQLARTLESEPMLVSQLVRLAIARVAINSLERLISAHALTREQAEQLRRELTAARPDRAMHLGMQGERCIGFDAMFLRPLAYLLLGATDVVPDHRETLPRAMMQLYRMSGLADRDVTFYLRTMNSVVTVATNSIPKRVALANDPTTFDPGSHGKLYILSSMLLPALNKALLKEADCLTAIAAADAALAVEAFRANNSGRIPNSLSELVPVYLSEVPIDPATEKPLTLVLGPVGYAIHGSGPLFTVRR